MHFSLPVYTFPDEAHAAYYKVRRYGYVMGIILDFLKEIPLSAVLRERLAETEKQIANLESENAILKSQVSALQSDLEHEQKEKNRYKDSLEEHLSYQGKLEPRPHDD